MAKAFLLCLLAWAWLSARTVTAADIDTDEKSRGRALLAEGLALMDNGQPQEALAKFEAAYRIVPSPKVLFNMGLAHRALGHTVDAFVCLEGFLGQLPDAPEEARSYAQHEVELLRADVSFLEIAASPPGAQLSEGWEAFIDDRPVGRLPLSKAIVVQPGSHWVVVRTAGREVFRQQVATLPGKQSQVLVAATPPPSLQAKGHRPWPRTAFWATAGLSGVALAAGITEQIVYQGKRSDYTDLLGRGGCNVGAVQRGQCENLRSAADTARTLAWLGYSVAAVSAGSALAFWFLEPKSRPSTRTDRASLGCAPVVGMVGFSGLSCVGRY